MGITFGDYVNTWTYSCIDNFNNYLINDQLFMHEYGHTIQSKRWGLLYLLSIGIPSGVSQLFDDWGLFNHNHDYFYSEVWANRNAKKYFKQYYGYEWNDLGYPTN